MFSLIISIIAIALVVVLAGASLYYGGDAFTQGSAKAQAATYVNQGQQIAAAITLHNVESGTALGASLTELETDGYMSAIPKPPAGEWVYDPDAKTLTVDIGNSDVCDKVNLQTGPFICDTEDSDFGFTYYLSGATVEAGDEDVGG